MDPPHRVRPSSSARDRFPDRYDLLCARRHVEVREIRNNQRKEVCRGSGCLVRQAQEIEYEEGGLIIWGFRQQVDAYASNVQGLEPSKYLPLGQYKFNKVSV